MPTRPTSIAIAARSGLVMVAAGAMLFGIAVIPGGNRALAQTQTCGRPIVLPQVPEALDRDRDGLQDLLERDHYGTDITAEDTNDDGIDGYPDGWDTDGDGYSDGFEAATGSSPTDPQSTPRDCN
jgi:hypothetical protein